MKRILIIKLWALGDILMATPLLTALRQAEPEMHISWIVDSSHADILAGHPLIDEVIPLDSRAWRLRLRQGDLFGWLEQGRTLNRQMQECRFDAVINCHPEKWWTRWLCAASVRIGLYPSRTLTLSRLAYTKAIPKPPSPRHNTDHYLAGAEALGFAGPFDRHMRLTVSEADRQAAAKFLDESAGFHPGKPLIVLHPGASRPSKCWSPAFFAGVADGLANACTLVVTGSSQELGLADSVVRAMGCSHAALVAAGQLTIGQTAALVERAAAVVTGDTSLLHIASALETPLVGIYLSTMPGDNAPLFGPQALLVGEQEATPVSALTALHSLLKETYEPSLSA